MGKDNDIHSIIDRINKSTDEEDVQLQEMPSNAASIIMSAVRAWQERESARAKKAAWTHHCQQCGNCCKATNDLLGGASIEDIAKWITAKRFDILKWVDPVMGPFGEVASFDIWIGPITHDEVNRCPWLKKKKGKKLYECSIHDLKPEISKEFPVSISHAKRFGCPVYKGKLPRRTKKASNASKSGRDDGEL